MKRRQHVGKTKHRKRRTKKERAALKTDAKTLIERVRITDGLLRFGIISSGQHTRIIDALSGTMLTKRIKRR